MYLTNYPFERELIKYCRRHKIPKYKNSTFQYYEINFPFGKFFVSFEENNYVTLRDAPHVIQRKYSISVPVNTIGEFFEKCIKHGFIKIPLKRLRTKKEHANKAWKYQPKNKKVTLQDRIQLQLSFPMTETCCTVSSVTTS